MSAESVAHSANTYSARVLLRGDPKDGNKTVKPVGGRISIPARAVKSFDLQPAVDKGLLSVE
jgi:hypothetical protein